MGVLGNIGSKTQHVIELATKLTIVGVPALYFAGWAYLDTYWSEFGVADELLGYMSTDDIRSGALVLVLAFIGSAGWVAITALVMVPLVIIMMAVRTQAMPVLFGASRRPGVFKGKLRKQGCVTSPEQAVYKRIMAMRMPLTLLPLLLLVLAGCGSRVGPPGFCAAAAELDADKHVTLERIDLYIMGGYQHGSAVFDDACPSIRPTVDTSYVPASASQKDRVDLATFWSTFLTKPRKAGGIFLVSVDATLAADIDGPVVRIEKMHQFNEVSEAEGAKLYQVLAARP